MEKLLNQNISLNIIEFAIILMISGFLLLIIALFNNNRSIKSKLDNIEKKIIQVNKEINEIVSSYGIIDSNLNASKQDLTYINETIKSIQKDIGKKTDENLSEQNINKAVDLAKLGASVEEISNKTGLSQEQIETLIKFHTDK